MLSVTFGNKKRFPVDASTGKRLLLLSDLEGITDDLTATIDGGEKVASWVSVDKTYADFSTAGTTNDIEIYSLPASGVIHAVIIQPTTNFSGGAISDYDISVGITGTLDKYCAAADVDSGAQTNATTSNLIPESWTAATSIRAAATSAGANLSAATAGAVTFHLLVSRIEAEA